ncbi:5-formyltetrahydrofolate cyclo-ligase [Streptococcus sp. DD12]|uniref:5-formyltetrahydrofolate cyclo-ligase n=1 Tax=Streptococcus sp. DD12 TaxID=1777880 RepID=UPI000796C879|nr:5-formyltetrahydrofolate cyclo-ligase [Streptococcus sp. DD12]KXT75463.1 5-formyltetrahydrofolate cyclo-ligase [Streptococcus sp. DD12]
MSSVKKNNRSQVLQEMKAIPAEVKADWDQSLLAQFVDHPAYQKAETIATYLAMPHEVDTALFIQRFLADGKTVLVPKTYPNRLLAFVAYDPEALEETSFGLLEPTSDAVVAPDAIDLIQVPGVCFNPEGYRIGYGAGFYDRFLANYKGKTLSTAYACQRLAFQPEPHDIPVGEVLYAPND